MSSPKRTVRSAFTEPQFWIAVGAASTLVIAGLLWTRATGPLDRTEHAPQRPVPPQVTPQDVLMTGDAPRLTDSLPIAPPLNPSTLAARVPGDDASATGDSTADASAAAPDSGSTGVAKVLPAAAAADTSERADATPTDSTDLTPKARATLRRLAELATSTDNASTSRQAAVAGASEQAPEMSSFEAAVSGAIPEDAGDDDGPTITGLVTDETQTKAGRDFYDAFYDRWTAPEKDYYYTVVVSEQPMPSLGTRVVVRVNQNVVFQTRLQPRYEIIEQAAKRAVYMTQRRLQSNLSMNVY